MKRLSLLTIAVAAALMVATPALAQPSGDTTVTFTVGTSNLSIEVPSSANIGSAFPGGTAAGQLGPVRVTDLRAAATATWTATVVATSFTTDAATPDETIPTNAISYWSGPATATTGTGTFVPGQLTSGDAVTLNTPRTAFSKTSGAGNNTATWNPTLEVAVPQGAVGGLYSGTVTHSIA
nr:hypothetical protein [Micromonospora sp. DSM 115978]